MGTTCRSAHKVDVKSCRCAPSQCLQQAVCKDAPAAYSPFPQSLHGQSCMACMNAGKVVCLPGGYPLAKSHSAARCVLRRDFLSGLAATTVPLPCCHSGGAKPASSSAVGTMEWLCAWCNAHVKQDQRHGACKVKNEKPEGHVCKGRY